MKAKEGVVDLLNTSLTIELTAINQYFLNAKMLQHWGLPGLAKKFRDLSFDEMRDAEELMDRLLYFQEHPNLQRLDPIQVGETPLEMLELGLELEKQAIDRLRRGVQLAHDKGDVGTREMLARMLVEEEEHTDDFESILDAIEHVGLQNYLARYATPEST